MTRAAIALLHGNVAEAVHLHPLAPIVVPLVGAFVLYASARYLRDGTGPAPQGKGRVALVAASVALWALLLAVWIGRFFGAFGGPVAV
jgi:hypothetical protein